MHITELTRTLVALPLADRMAAMEALWQSFDKDALPQPDWHEEVLDQRWADLQSGKATTSTWEEAKTRLNTLGKIARV